MTLVAQLTTGRHACHDIAAVLLHISRAGLSQQACLYAYYRVTVLQSNGVSGFYGMEKWPKKSAGMQQVFGLHSMQWLKRITGR